MFSFDQVAIEPLQKIASLPDRTNVYFAGKTKDGDEPAFVFSKTTPTERVLTDTRFLVFGQVLKFAQDEIQFEPEAEAFLSGLGIEG